jgi:hypothetical protein
MDETPGSAGHIHVLGMAVRAAILTEFGLEYIQDCSLFPICIAGFRYGETTCDLSADKPDPSLGHEIDPGNTSVVVFI